MPFKSKAQQKFAFATDQPWAREWARETPNIKSLPRKVKKVKAKEKAKRTEPKKAEKKEAKVTRRKGRKLTKLESDFVNGY